MRNRVIAATLGLLLPVALAGAADAATTHKRHHTPAAHVQSATYRTTTHKPRAHRTSAATHHRAPVAQTTGS